jgi:nitrogenase molybdenum-iron protein beta chain
LPIGGIETTSFLKQVIEAVDFTEEQKAKALRFIETEEEIYYSFIERMACFMLEFRYGIPRRFYSLLDASYSLGVSKFLLNELGILPAHQYIVDNTPEIFQTDFANCCPDIGSPVAEVSFGPMQGKFRARSPGDFRQKADSRLGLERDLAKKI